METENRITGDIFMWYWNNYCLPVHNPRSIIFHVPNENSHTLKSQGVIAGVSDFVLIHKKKTYFVEVKTETGKQSHKQKKFQYHVEDCLIPDSFGPSPYLIVRSLTEFKTLIKSL